MKRALIVRTSALGDVACSLPAAGSIKEAWPECEVTWIVDKRFSGLVECCAFVDQTVKIEKGFGALSQQVKELGEFDVALDLQGLLKSAGPVFLAKAKQKLGYHWQREGAALLVSRVMPLESSVHVVEQYLDVARAAGGGDSVRFGLAAQAEDVKKVNGVLREAGLEDGQRLVLSNAGAGWAAKRWPAENYASLVAVVESAGGRVGFIGTEVDRPSFEAVLAAGATGAMDLLGKTNVRELVALLDSATVIVAGDTGALHIAAGLGKPCVGIYTQTRPERSCAYGQLENCRETDPARVIGRVLELMGQAT